MSDPIAQGGAEPSRPVGTGGQEPSALGEGILRGGAAVAAAVVLAKLSGIAWNWVLLWAFTDRAVTDAYLFASGLVFAVFSVAQQSVAPAFLPVFLEERSRHGERAAWGFAVAAFLAVAATASAAAAAAIAFPGAWAELSSFLTGARTSPASAELLSTGVSWMAPAFVGIAASVATYMALNAYKRFFWAHAGESVMRFIMIAAMLAAVATGLAGVGAVRWLALGVVAGAFARLLVHLVALGRRLGSCGLREFRGAAFRRFLALAAPLLVGVLFSTLRDLVNHYAVLWPQEGLVTANSNGRRIFTAMGELVPMSLSIAMFPFFCELVDRNDAKALGELLTRSGRALALVFFPFSAAVAALSGPFAYVIFGSTGKLSSGELSLVALANACYVTVLPAYAVEFPVTRGFFSTRRMIAPTAAGVVFSFLSVGVSVLAIGVLGLQGEVALAAVALGYVATRYMKLGVMIALLRRTVPAFPLRESCFFLARALAVAAAAGGAAWAVRAGYELFFPIEEALARGRLAMLLRTMPLIALAGGAAIVCALGAIRLLRMEELAMVAAWIRQRRRGRPAQAAQPRGDE